MKAKKNRICIYPKDVSMITGKTLRSSYFLLNRIRKFLQKKPHQAISVTEFCDYIGLLPDDVLGMLDQQ